MQMFTSAKTSVNKTKLPASTRKISWELFRGKNVLDYGGGSYDNLKDFLKERYDINLYIYDPYNRDLSENIQAMDAEVDLVICNNVLNVIDSEEEIREIIRLGLMRTNDIVFSVYQGDKTSIGRKSKEDCYQRNMRVQEYLKFFPEKTAFIYKGLITTNKNLIKGDNNMEKLYYKGLVFDEWSTDKEEYEGKKGDSIHYWASICEHCIEKHRDIFPEGCSEISGDEGWSVCSIDGCNISGETMEHRVYYIDFDPKFVEIK